MAELSVKQMQEVKFKARYDLVLSMLDGSKLSITNAKAESAVIAGEFRFSMFITFWFNDDEYVRLLTGSRINYEDLSKENDTIKLIFGSKYEDIESKVIYITFKKGYQVDLFMTLFRSFTGIELPPSNFKYLVRTPK